MCYKSHVFVFQMLVYLFYFVPYYVMAIYGLFWPGCEWMTDWSIIHAGAAMQVRNQQFLRAVPFKSMFGLIRYVNM